MRSRKASLLVPFAAVLLLSASTGCGPGAYSADDGVPCGDACEEAPPAAASSVSQASIDGGAIPLPYLDGGAKADASALDASASADADASADASGDAGGASTTTTTCACEFPGAHGNVVTKACGATICWKPSNGATQYSLWVCNPNDTASPTFQACSTPE